jgi:3-methyladenine DNA glycosylase AlkC
MPDKLKDFFGEPVVRQIAGQIAVVHPAFPVEAFVSDSLDGLEALELTERGRHISEALARHLPEPYEVAVDVLVASLGPVLQQTEGNGMEPFLYLPHVFFVASRGLDHFEPSMRAQYEITQRFSAEYSIRLFIDRYPDATYARLTSWASDPSVHVRRLVSEGTRPRLPWAPRLRAYQTDPTPVVQLLELLKDDPELYVRRSVANNLNDIGKDHPDLLVGICRRWWSDATPERRWLIRHALRSLVKAGHPDALTLLGFKGGAEVAIEAVRVAETRVPIGAALVFSCDLVSTSEVAQDLLVDYRVQFVKASGGTTPKVFKLRALVLGPGERIRLGGRVSFADMTTRRHYPGRHALDLLVNGTVLPLAEFDVVGRDPSPSAPSPAQAPG